jgi:YlmC/YmxH family sporulation protein
MEKRMRIYELRQKEVINICDCQRLGYVSDVEFDICTGQIHKIIVPGPCKLWGIIGRENEYIIDFCAIKQIGADVILVKINSEQALVKCKFY